MTFIFSVHLPIAGMSLIPVLLNWPLALLPVHILFLELIIDPTCSVVFEMESDEADIMHRKPRRLSDPLFGREMIFTGLVQGVGVLALVAIIYAVVITSGFGEGEARALAFTTLVIGNLGLIFSNRSHSRSIIQTLRIPNKALWLVTASAVGFLVLVFSVPGLRELFGFAAIHPADLALCAGVGLISILIAESVKLPFMRRLFTGQPAK
jgi:Ca2+-transporting ATPase